MLSATVTAEVPAIAFELLAIAFVVAAGRWTGRRQLALAALGGAALAAGTLTKLFVLVAVVPAVIYLLAAARGRSIGAAVRLVVCFAAGGLLVIADVLAPLWERRDAIYDQMIGFHLDAAASGGGPLEILRTLAFSAQAPLYLLALGVLVLLARRRRPEAVPPLLWGLASLIFLLGLRPVFRHHDVLLAPPAALLAALAPRAWRRNGRRELAQPAFAMAVIAVMVVGTATPLVRAVQPSGRVVVNQLMATELRATTRAGDLVVSDEPYVVAMAGRQVPPPLVGTSFMRLRSGSLHEGDIEATILASGTRAVLFTGGRFEKLPRLRRWVDNHFRLAHDFGDGRALYLR